jgi:hypothetical protein
MNELDVLTAKGLLEESIIKIEYKWNEGKPIEGLKNSNGTDIPTSVLELIKTLYMQRQAYSFIDELKEDLKKLDGGYKITSSKYMRLQIANAALKVERDKQEKKIERLTEGIK